MGQGQREKQAVSQTAGSALIAGSIGDALAMHARERIVHFFNFLFAISACCKRAAAAGVAINPWDVVSAVATHQVDKGFRMKPANKHYYDFDDTDVKVIDRSASSCRNTDAAHFCNLGLKAGPWAQLAALSANDPHLFAMLEMAKRLAGNTRHLPQRINIGPDRIIDEAHGELAIALLQNGGPIVSTFNVGIYLQHCSAVMQAYRDAAEAAELFGLAKCCDAYLDVYKAGPDGPMYTLRGYVWSECEARSQALDRNDYLGN